MEYRISVITVFLIQMMDMCASFNLDVTLPTIHYGDEGSLFGFSVAMHREGTATRLLVGAPKDQSREHEDIIEGGLLYHCSTFNSSESCQIVRIHKKGQITNKNGIQTGNKSHELFASIVRSAGPDSYVLVCAPNHVRFFNIYEPGNEDHFASGICYIASDILTSPDIYTKFQPCKDYSTSSRQMCQVGFSGLMFKDSFVVGAPGSHFFQGQLFQYNISSNEHSQTRSKSIRFDDSYQGYSIATGDLDGNGTIDYVTGAPKSFDIFGSVLVYSSTDDFDEPMFEIVGYQLGAYFGHSVQVADLNGDGLDDLVVGAPTYSDLTSAVPLHDIGRIYIYYQQDMGTLALDPQVIQGFRSDGRFGFTLASLGDINLDGIHDLAVSAPYENNNEGAVYIFNGHLDGIRSNPSQIITPSRRGVRLFRGFGFALSGDFDIDENGYPDLLVGAPHSSSVVLYRASPIIRLALNIQFDVKGVTFRNNNVELPDGSLVVGFNTTTCLQYDGNNVSENAVFRCSLKADSTTTVKSRAVFSHDGVQREIVTEVYVQKNQRYCVTYTTYLKNHIEGYQPLVFTMKCSLLHDIMRSDDDVHTVLENEEETTVRQLPIFTNCSADKCASDLQLKVERNLDNGTLSEAVIIGESTPINVTVTISNVRYEAYGAQLFVTLPQGVYYSDTRRTFDQFISCSVEDGSMSVLCDLESPFKGQGHSVTFDILFTADKVDGTAELIDIEFLVTSFDAETGERVSDNTEVIYIPVDAQVRVVLKSDSIPAYQYIFSGEEYAYYPKYTHEDEVGMEVTHVYAVHNFGPSDISTAELTIYWPMLSYYGYLLYIVNITLSTGETCEVDKELNPINLQLLQREVIDYIDNSSAEQTNSSTSAEPVSYESVTEGIYVDIPTNRSRNNVKRTAKANTAHKDRAERYRNLMCQSGMEECYTITCPLRNLIGSGNRKVVKVQIRSRIWEDTFKLLTGNHWSLTSTAMLRVTNLPYNIEQIIYPTVYASTTIDITRSETLELPLSDAPIWIIIVSICGGILLLTAILGILVKVGFFTRRTQFKKIEEDEKINDSPVHL